MRINMKQIEAGVAVATPCPGGGVAILEPVEGFERMVAFCKDGSDLPWEDTNWDWVRKDFRKAEKKSKNGK